LLKPGGPTQPYPGRAAGEGLSVMARVAKSQDSVDANDIFQAGPGQQILVDQAGNVVYYTGLLNEDFWNFVTANKLYELSALTGVSPTQDFPVNTVELKLAWRVAAYLDDSGKPSKGFIPDADRYYHTEAQSVPVGTVLDGKSSCCTLQRSQVHFA